MTDKKYQCKYYKLDDIEIDNFDILLIDVEGNEYEFLKGAKNKIIKNKPIINIEIWPDDKRLAENMITSKNKS